MLPQMYRRKYGIVALRKESVDRNAHAPPQEHQTNTSLSARRAWIEISTYVTRLPRCQVSLSARRAWIEMSKTIPRGGHIRSLSARRAWIEIVFCGPQGSGKTVALRKESVDRNSTYVTRLPRCQVSLSARRAWIEIYIIKITGNRPAGRSPQGERG